MIVGSGIDIAEVPRIRNCIARFGERFLERIYTPGEIRLKKGVPVVLEITTQDVVMGFNAPDLGARADIIPGQVARVRLVPNKAGTFEFHCDIFCGTGHEDMSGTIVVTE